MIRNDYFEWLCDQVRKKRYLKHVSFRRLFEALHSTEFVYLRSMDEDRAADGEALRYRFASSECDTSLPVDDVLEYLEGPCSVLEMMVALAIRCEEETMDDPTIGNRTSQWFWSMITNLGLSSMTDDKFDDVEVYDIIDRFMSREYEPDGRGGLFRIRGCREDLRGVDIWCQLSWYLNSIT